MRILYVSQYYPPEMGAPAARVSELARLWAKRGHEVTVLTAFPHHPHGVKRPQDVRVLTRREKDGDVELVRTYVYATRNAGFIRRILSYISFMISAILIGTFRVGKPDIVVATSPQLFTAIAGWWISLVKGAPFVFEVRDLWPESIVTVGAMRDSLMVKMLRLLAQGLYSSAERVVTVGEGYRRRILSRYRVDAAKIDVITNGVDLSRFQFSESDRQKTRAQYGWQDKFVGIYLGCHGMSHGLDLILDAADQMRSDPDVQFVFVGDGAEKPKLQKIAERRQLSNVTFLDPQDKETVVRLYAASDVCLVPLKKADLFTDVLPSKMFEIMSMRRPMILSVDGDARMVMERARCGLFIEPENRLQFCRAFERLKGDSELRQQMGDNGRRFVELFYCRRVLADRYLRLLHVVAEYYQEAKQQKLAARKSAPVADEAAASGVVPIRSTVRSEVRSVDPVSARLGQEISRNGEQDPQTPATLPATFPSPAGGIAERRKAS